MASDHAGYDLKILLMGNLEKAGHVVEDFGCRNSRDSVDVMDFVSPASEAVGAGKFDFGVFVDGAGYPSGMVANFHHGVFAAVCNDPVSAKLAREHGGANVICLGAMIVGNLVATQVLESFLSASPLPGKYETRREKVRQLALKKRLSPTFRVRSSLTIEDLKEAIERKEPLHINEKTIITPSVIDAVKSMRP